MGGGDDFVDAKGGTNYIFGKQKREMIQRDKRARVESAIRD